MIRRTLLPLFSLFLVGCAPIIALRTPTPSPSAAPTRTAAPSPTAEATGTAEADTAVVRAALVNVRAEPAGEVVGQLTAGTDVRVIDCDGDWCQIETDKVSGFVFVGCLSIADGRGCVAK